MSTFWQKLAGYAALGVALLVAGLIAALKIQGSRLHKAQVALLAQSSQQGVAQAQKRYDDALQAFLRAGGTLLLAICLSLPHQAPANNNPDLLPACELALDACDKLIKAQKDEIQILQKAADTNPPPSFWQSIPWPIWLALGIVSGYSVGMRLK